MTTAPPKRRRLLLLLPALALGVALGGYVAYAHYGWVRGMAGTVLASEAADSTTAPIEYGTFWELPGLIVNPAETDGSRYLMVNVGFESADAAVLEELAEKQIVVRDEAIRLFSAYTIEHLAALGNREALKDDLRARVNAVLRSGSVDRLYFTQYVIQ